MFKKNYKVLYWKKRICNVFYWGEGGGVGKGEGDAGVKW